MIQFTDFYTNNEKYMHNFTTVHRLASNHAELIYHKFANLSKKWRVWRLMSRTKNVKKDLEEYIEYVK